MAKKQTKSEAQKLAKSIRKMGAKARVVKDERKGYIVMTPYKPYKRGKK